MRAVIAGWCLACCVAAGAEQAAVEAAVAEVVEPVTKVKFAAEVTSGGKTLACTGVGLRRVYGMSVYAIAHYGAAAHAPAAAATTEEQLAHWVAASGAKALEIRFVLEADRHNLRHFAETSLKEAGYAGDLKDALLDAFARDYPAGSVVRLAAQDGVLSVFVDGAAQGQFEDADLVRALWQCWLGEKSVLVDREALVAHAKAKPTD